MKKYVILLLTLFCVVQFAPNAYSQQKKRSNITDAEIRKEINILKAQLEDLNKQIARLKSTVKKQEYELEFSLVKGESSEAVLRKMEILNRARVLMTELESEREETKELISIKTGELVQQGVVKEMQDRGLYDSNFNRPEFDKVTGLIYEGKAEVSDYVIIMNEYRMHPRLYTELPETEQIKIMSSFDDKLKITEGERVKINNEQETIVLNLCDMWEKETGFRPDPKKTKTIMSDYMTKKSDNVKDLMLQINNLDPDNSFTPAHPQYQSLEKFVDASEKYYQQQNEEAVKTENEVITLKNAFNELVHMCPKCAQELDSKKVIEN